MCQFNKNSTRPFAPLFVSGTSISISMSELSHWLLLFRVAITEPVDRAHLSVDHKINNCINLSRIEKVKHIRLLFPEKTHRRLIAQANRSVASQKRRSFPGLDQGRKNEISVHVPPLHAPIFHTRRSTCTIPRWRSPSDVPWHEWNSLFWPYIQEGTSQLVCCSCHHAFDLIRCLTVSSSVVIHTLFVRTLFVVVVVILEPEFGGFCAAGGSRRRRTIDLKTKMLSERLLSCFAALCTHIGCN